MKERIVLSQTKIKYITGTNVGHRKCWGIDDKFSLEASETSMWTKS